MGGWQAARREWESAQVATRRLVGRMAPHLDTVHRRTAGDRLCEMLAVIDEVGAYYLPLVVAILRFAALTYLIASITFGRYLLLLSVMFFYFLRFYDSRFISTTSFNRYAHSADPCLQNN